MKIYFNTFNYATPSFTCNSKQFRQECSQRIQTNSLSETNKRNLSGLAESFSTEGLTFQQCLKAAKRSPFMLVQKPETLENNIREIASRFSEFGVTSESHLKCALRHPPLFLMLPSTIENNMRRKAELFKDEGLTLKDLIKMAQSQPNVYTVNPESLNKKANQIAQGIECTRADVLEIFKAHPTTCSLDSAEIIKKFKFLTYIERNKFIDAGKTMPNETDLKRIVLKKSLTNSMELNNLILLRNKISAGLPNGQKLPFDHLRDAVGRFIQANNSEIIELKLPADKLAKDFIKFVKKFSESIVGKNIFAFKIV